MALNLPTLGRLDIISVTYGSKDFTLYARDAFKKALVLDPRMQAWTFSASNTFFGEDPNKNIFKVCSAVYRNTIPTQNEVWSTFKRVNAAEDHDLRLSFSGQGDTPGQLPRASELPRNATFVIAAFWWTKDVTTQVAAAVSNAGYTPSKPTTITVGTSVFGTAPAGMPTRAGRWLMLTYGLVTATGYKFGVVVPISPNSTETADWTVEVPVAFPPVDLPVSKTQCNWLLLENTSTSFYLYPKIVDVKGNLIWDGLAVKMGLAPGSFVRSLLLSCHVLLCEK